MATESMAPAGPAPRDGWSLRCPGCGADAPINGGSRGCPACAERGRVVAMHLHYERWPAYPGGPPRGTGIWSQWGTWLPGVHPECRLTLGEGDTPLLRVDALCELTGCPNLYLKMEAQNPSGAHKDRFHAVTTAIAADLGMRGVVSMSTGNHGLSMAAYAAAHGLEAVVIANDRMPLLLQRAIRFAGGLPLFVSGDTGTRVQQALIDSGEWLAALTLWPMPFSSPLGVEGYKTIAYEIYRDLGERMADRLFVPTAGADLLTGLWFGQRDLERAGMPISRARMHAVQPTGASPLVAALDAGLDHIPELERTETIALSIGDPITGRQALGIVRESGGSAIAVPDDEILAAGRFLGKCGLFVEPSSVAPVAALRAWAEANPDRREETIVCVLTSSALKWLDDYGAATTASGVPVDSLDHALTTISRHVDT